MQCKHCCENIVQHTMAGGPVWFHQPSGASFLDSINQYCRTTIAEPREDNN